MFEMLGFKAESDITIDEKRNVEIIFMSNGDYKIEVISPLNAESPIISYLNKVGNTPYHLCYETADIEETINQLRKNRFLVVEKPSEAVAINNQRVAFMYHPNYGLLELLEV
jgi:methylmalonyl-CoA/ethylmalonyl-CoA epimerase